jgi:hypothetical protein
VRLDRRARHLSYFSSLYMCAKLSSSFVSLVSTRFVFFVNPLIV